MKIALVISSLGPGGAERVLANMANFWATGGDDVTIITLSSCDSDFYPLNPSIKRLCLNLFSPSHNVLETLINNIKRLVRLRMTIKNLHTPLVISFMDIMNIQVLLATLGLPIRVIVSDRSDPDRHDIGLIWFTLRRIIYRRAAFVVILSEAYRSWFQKNTGINPVVIPNPLTPESSYETPVNLRNQLGLSPTTKILVSMGRLDYFKGFDILLKAWHQINRSHPDWHLIIIGEGSLRTELEQLCVQLNISQKVSFIGLVKAPYVFLRQGNLFALSTRYESFGNVFIEAMYCGLPVVATNCTGAISEIIKDNYNGLLVPIDDPDALAKALHRLMDDDDLRLKMAANGSDVSNRYNIENIMAMWEKVIQG